MSVSDLDRGDGLIPERYGGGALFSLPQWLVRPGINGLWKRSRIFKHNEQVLSLLPAAEETTRDELVRIRWYGSDSFYSSGSFFILIMRLIQYMFQRGHSKWKSFTT